MNKRIYFPFAVLLLLILSKCGPTQQDAMNYHKKIIHEQHLVIGYINEMVSAFSTFEPTKIKLAMDSAMIQIDESIIVLEGIESFDEDKELLESCLNFFEANKNLLKNEYTEQLEIYILPIEEYTDVEKDRFNELHKIIDEKYYPVFDRFSKAEEEFAKKWNLELIPADL